MKKHEQFEAKMTVSSDWKSTKNNLIELISDLHDSLGQVYEESDVRYLFISALEAKAEKQMEEKLKCHRDELRNQFGL
jgi:hypothetical protein